MKKNIFIIVLTFLSFILISCKRELENDKTEYETVTITHKVSKFEKMDGKNEVYKRVDVTEGFYVNPKKVVTFSLGVADTFNYFGLEKLGIEEFGIPKDMQKLPTLLDEFNDKKYKDVGSLFDPDFNVIELINPDLIILDGRSANYYSQIKKDYPYINVLDASLTTYDLLEQETVFNNLSLIFPNIKNELNSIIGEFKNSFNEIKEYSKNYNAMFLQLNGKVISAATNKNGRYKVLYNEFGFNFKDLGGNLSENNHGTAEISIEKIREANPDVIFIMDRNVIVEGKKSDLTFLNESIIKNVEAIKNDDVYQLHPESWYTITGGINATYKMIDDVNSFINKLN